MPKQERTRLHSLRPDGQGRLSERGTYRRSNGSTAQGGRFKPCRWNSPSGDFRPANVGQSREREKAARRHRMASLGTSDASSHPEPA